MMAVDKVTVNSKNLFLSFSLDTCCPDDELSTLGADFINRICKHVPRIMLRLNVDITSVFLFQKRGQSEG
jgi:hypothetical protein